MSARRLLQASVRSAWFRLSGVPVGRKVPGGVTEPGTNGAHSVMWRPLIEVRTDDRATCGAHFAGRSTTGVAAMRNEGNEVGDLYVDWCTAHVSIEELEEVFGAGYPPDETLVLEEPSESSTPSRTLLVGGAAFVLFATVVGLARLKRRTVG